MYGIELADNIIVGSGSIVTKSFSESNIIIAGNPARKIGTWESFAKKWADMAVTRSELKDLLNGESPKLIKK